MADATQYGYPATKSGTARGRDKLNQPLSLSLSSLHYHPSPYLQRARWPTIHSHGPEQMLRPTNGLPPVDTEHQTLHGTREYPLEEAR